jgi:hypothetical protein
MKHGMMHACMCGSKKAGNRRRIAMSAWSSTYGYVAYSFAGVKPWILLRLDWNNKEFSEVACVRSPSSGCLARLVDGSHRRSSALTRI